MANWKKLASGAAGAAGAGEALNVEDVFSTYLYYGNQTARTITNGIDLAGEGGLTWITPRTTAAEMQFIDSERGVGASTPVLISSMSNGEINRSGAVTAYNSDGFDLGTYDATNYSGRDMVSWTFRKAPKFFDVVTYSGSSSAQTISHNLGVVPAVIIVKQLNSSGRWTVYHKDASPTGNPENGRMALNTTDAWAEYPTVSSFQNLWNLTAPTSTHFTVGTDATTGASGSTYVAYLFAHNDGDGEFGPTGDADIIKCGSYTLPASGDVFVDLGWEPQWVLFKRVDGAGNWYIVDNMRGLTNNNTLQPQLEPNTSDAESNVGFANIFSNGFGRSGFGVEQDYIYIAIRRGPMAVPESADDVFDIATRDGTTYNGPDPDFSANHLVDFVLYKDNITTTGNWVASSRLQQGQRLIPNTTSTEASSSFYSFDYMSGWGNSGNSADTNDYSWMWRRAPNFFDVVAYDGNSSVNTLNHNLGVAPEMMWIKARNDARNWFVYHKDVGITKYLELDNNASAQDFSTWANNTAPTDTQFTVNTGFANLNSSSNTYIAYLFASLDGISKVGSYSGSNSDLNIDCGFTNGAKFILIKRTDAVGNWAIWDTDRGITAGSTDPFLALNLTNAQFTTLNVIEPYSSGFTVKGNLNYYNQSGGSFIFYAIAA